MSPLDDELRAALAARADTLRPSPDTLPKVERRARGMRRNRALAAVAGSAAAITAIALAVPALSPSSGHRTEPPAVTAPAPLITSPGLDARPAGAFDWDRPPIGDDGLDRAVRDAWGAAHHVDPAAVSGDRLYVHTLRDGLVAGIYQLWAGGVAPRTVVAQAERGAPAVLARDELSDPGARLVAGVVSRTDPWVVVALSPWATEVNYEGPGGGSAAIAPTGIWPGTAFPREGAPDRVTAKFGDDTTAEADPGGGRTDGAPGTSDWEPSNLLASWPTRGNLRAAPLREVRDAYARALGRGGDAEEVRLKVLFAGSSDGIQRYVFAQAWLPGQAARTVGYVTPPEQSSGPFLGPVTPADPPVLAFLVCCTAGTSTDTLVVVPAPGTDRVLYAPSAGGEPRPVGRGQEHLGGVVLVDVPRDAPGSGRLRLVDGDGRVTFDGPVAPLLCALKECG